MNVFCERCGYALHNGECPAPENVIEAMCRTAYDGLRSIWELHAAIQRLDEVLDTLPDQESAQRALAVDGWNE